MCALLQVQGLSKAGKEFDVEVVVTSFVIEGEMYYTGIITEVKGLTRQLSASSLSSEIEIKERQQKVNQLIQKLYIYLIICRHWQ